MEDNRKDKLGQDDSQGQQHYYGNQEHPGDYERDANQGEYDKDVNQVGYDKDIYDTSTSLEEKEDEDDVVIHDVEDTEKLEQDEVDMPERERSTTAPHAECCSEPNKSNEQNCDTGTCDTDKDDKSKDKDKRCC